MYANMMEKIFPARLDAGSGVPLRVQLREGLLAAIGRGRLRPGDRLPTMRELAVHLAIDLNTVQRAYAELERLGAIETRRARGSFVSATPPLADADARDERLEACAAAAIASARAQGLLPEEVAREIIRKMQAP